MFMFSLMINDVHVYVHGNLKDTNVHTLHTATNVTLPIMYKIASVLHSSLLYYKVTKMTECLKFFWQFSTQRKCYSRIINLQKQNIICSFKRAFFNVCNIIVV